MVLFFHYKSLICLQHLRNNSRQLYFVPLISEYLHVAGENCQERKCEKELARHGEAFVNKPGVASSSGGLEMVKSPAKIWKYYVGGVKLISSVRCVLTVRLCILSCVQLFETLWTITCQVPLSIELSQQEYWSRQPFTPPGSKLLPDPGTEPVSLASPALEGGFFTTILRGKPVHAEDEALTDFQIQFCKTKIQERTIKI